MKKTDLLRFIKEQQLSAPLEMKVTSYLSTFPEDISEQQMKVFSDFIEMVQAQNAAEAEKALQTGQQLDLAVETIQQENLRILEDIRRELESGSASLELTAQKATAAAVV